MKKQNLLFNNEFNALKNCLALNKGHYLDIFLLYVDNKLVAFTINEVIKEEHVIGHFAKFNTSYKGVWDFLLLKTNEYYSNSNLRFFNQQQDLGIDLLRKSKEQNSNLTFLKKFKRAKNNHDNI